MHIKQVHTFVVSTIVQLDLVVAKVFLSRMVSDVENPLSLVAQQTKISHVHCLQTLTLGSRIHNSNSSRIVDMHRSGELRMVKFLKSKP